MSSMRLGGWPATMRSRTPVSRACGSTPSSLAAPRSEAGTARCSAPRSEPANRAFLRASATGRISRSTTSVSSATRPSSTNGARPSRSFGDSECGGSPRRGGTCPAASRPGPPATDPRRRRSAGSGRLARRGAARLGGASAASAPALSSAISWTFGPALGPVAGTALTLQRQLELAGVELLRAPPEHRASERRLDRLQPGRLLREVGALRARGREQRFSAAGSSGRSASERGGALGMGGAKPVPSPMRRPRARRGAPRRSLTRRRRAPDPPGVHAPPVELK